MYLELSRLADRFTSEQEVRLMVTWAAVKQGLIKSSRFRGCNKTALVSVPSELTVLEKVVSLQVYFFWA